MAEPGEEKDNGRTETLPRRRRRHPGHARICPGALKGPRCASCGSEPGLVPVADSTIPCEIVMKAAAEYANGTSCPLFTRVAGNILSGQPLLNLGS